MRLYLRCHGFNFIFSSLNHIRRLFTSPVYLLNFLSLRNLVLCSFSNRLNKKKGGKFGNSALVWTVQGLCNLKLCNYVKYLLSSEIFTTPGIPPRVLFSVFSNTHVELFPLQCWKHKPVLRTRGLNWSTVIKWKAFPKTRRNVSTLVTIL